MKTTIDNTKLAGVIRSLTRSERARCRKFLESPYFNTNQDLVKLFSAVDTLLQKDKSLEKHSLWKKLRKEPYNDVRFRKYCSDLSKLLEHFLAQLAFEADTDQQQVFLLKSLKSRDEAEKLRNSIMRAAQSLADNPPHIDVEFYLHQYQVQRSFYDIFDFETRRSDKANLEEISANLDLLYFSEKLRISCEILQRKNFKTFDYKSSFTEELRTYLKETDLIHKSPIIALYYQVFLMWKNFEDESHYYRLKELIGEYGSLLPPETAVEDLYTTAQNYCVQRINQGNRKYLNELFDIFKMMIENGLLTIGGEMNPWYFRNIIVVALRLGEYEWTENFIASFKDFLPDGLKQNAVSYNLAQLYFYQKKYDDVVVQLHTVDYDDLSYNLNSKTLLLATYYELDEIDLLESHAETFNTFLKRRRDFPDERKGPYRDLIRFTRKLIRILPNDQDALNKLKEDILAKKNVANANWLLGKIADLER
jgi:hypothetical protein